MIEPNKDIDLESNSHTVINKFVDILNKQKYCDSEFRRRKHAYLWMACYTIIYIPLIITNLYIGILSSNHTLNVRVNGILFTLRDFLIISSCVQMPTFASIIWDCWWINIALYEKIIGGLLILLGWLVLFPSSIVIMSIDITTIVLLSKIKKEDWTNDDGLLYYIMIALFIQILMTIITTIIVPHRVPEKKAQEHNERR